MFTRQHYTAIAKVMAETRPDYGLDSQSEIDRTVQWTHTLDEFVRLFNADNPRFQADEFRQAAGEHRDG